MTPSNREVSSQMSYVTPPLSVAITPFHGREVMTRNVITHNLGTGAGFSRGYIEFFAWEVMTQGYDDTSARSTSNMAQTCCAANDEANRD